MLATVAAFSGPLPFRQALVHRAIFWIVSRIFSRSVPLLSKPVIYRYIRCRAVAKRGEEAQQRNAELTQKFLNSVINNLRGQAESNQAMTQELADQQRRGQGASQSLTQESVSVYVDFVNSMFSSYQGGEAAEGGTREDESRDQGVGGLTLEYYDSLNVNEISERLDDLSIEEIERLRDYEVRKKNRQTLLERLNARIEASSSS